jgi:mono/diheme cytochrome c family protein
VKCFSCHDGTGAGTNYGPALSARVPTLDDAQLRAVILDGKGKMPPFRTKLTDAEADAIITWLQQRFGDAR